MSLSSPVINFYIIGSHFSPSTGIRAAVGALKTSIRCTEASALKASFAQEVIEARDSTTSARSLRSSKAIALEPKKKCY